MFICLYVMMYQGIQEMLSLQGGSPMYTPVGRLLYILLTLFSFYI